ncbi:Hpt domain-containing protein [Peptostreptococcaceae bacterium AGR-M142]
MYKIYIDLELKDIVPIFFETREEELVLLEKYYNEKDSLKISDLAHKIKGSGTSFGFSDLNTIGNKLEKAAKKEDFDMIKMYIDELENYINNLEIYYI